MAELLQHPVHFIIRENFRLADRQDAAIDVRQVFDFNGQGQCARQVFLDTRQAVVGHQTGLAVAQRPDDGLGKLGSAKRGIVRATDIPSMIGLSVTCRRTALISAKVAGKCNERSSTFVRFSNIGAAAYPAIDVVSAPPTLARAAAAET